MLNSYCYEANISLQANLQNLIDFYNQNAGGAYTTIIVNNDIIIKTTVANLENLRYFIKSVYL